ncbi:MAG TPA: metallopeptidase TldD-related protein [Mycobacteriales bacterium]|jgi:predicted Zn-dependent protease
MSAALAAAVLELVRAAAPGAEAEVTAGHGTHALTRFANSFVHQNVADTATRVRLRLHVDGRTASGSTAATDPGALGRLVAGAVAAARMLPPDAGWPGLGGPAPVLTPGNRDEVTADTPPEARVAVVRDFVAAAGGLETAGYCRTGTETLYYANTAGQVAESSYTAAAADGIARTPAGPDGLRADGVARRGGVAIAGLDGTALGTVAAAKARAGADPVELPPGRYEVVLEPSAVADLLTYLGLYGFNGRLVNEGRSFLAPGTAQFDAAVTLDDDATDPAAVGPGFDAEGTPKRRTPLVAGGVAGGPVHDRRTAREAGTESTGHAVPGGEQFGAAPLNLFLRPGGGGSVDHLVAGMERGLLVSDLWYTRVLDPKTLVVTGLTRNGVWLVEDGRVRRAVRNLRFTQSYPEALAAGAVLAAGSEPVSVPVSWDLGVLSTPALRLASWNMTGGASG